MRSDVAWLAEIELIPVPPFSLGLSAYELLPDGCKRCIECANVLNVNQFGRNRNRCRDCANPEGRRTYKLHRAPENVRARILARRDAELLEQKANDKASLSRSSAELAKPAN